MDAGCRGGNVFFAARGKKTQIGAKQCSPHKVLPTPRLWPPQLPSASNVPLVNSCHAVAMTPLHRLKIMLSALFLCGLLRAVVIADESTAQRAFKWQSAAPEEVGLLPKHFQRSIAIYCGHVWLHRFVPDREAPKSSLSSISVTITRRFMEKRPAHRGHS